MCDFYTRTQEPYEFLLQRREWKAKRLIILNRDHYTCRKCGISNLSESRLHVHHKHYIYGLDPWEYKDTELITLCEDCHKEIHSTTEIHHYRLNKKTNMLEQVEFTPCCRCDGVGYFSEYRHVQNGICFRCHGARYDEFITSSENYAKEHNIDISDIDNGFMPMPKENTSTYKIVIVKKSNYKDALYLQIITNNGDQYYACLDFSVDAKPGDKLDPKTLLFKYGINKHNNSEYVVMKGKII